MSLQELLDQVLNENQRLISENQRLKSENQSLNSENQRLQAKNLAVKTYSLKIDTSITEIMGELDIHQATIKSLSHINSGIMRQNKRLSDTIYNSRTESAKITHENKVLIANTKMSEDVIVMLKNKSDEKKIEYNNLVHELKISNTSITSFDEPNVFEIRTIPGIVPDYMKTTVC